MALKDDLLKLSQESKPGPRCRLSKLLATLTPELRAELVDIIRCDDINITVIARHFGGAISEGIVSHHRRGECKGCRDSGTFPRG